jgi:hypothetical protein
MDEGTNTRAIELATMVIGGSEGGYCTIGGERDIDLDVNLSLNGIRAGREFTSMLPVPGQLLNHLVVEKGPEVILPDGSEIQKSHRSEHEWQFTDGVARLWAAENNGIYFPSNFGAEDCWIKFSDYLRALERCVPNMLKDKQCSTQIQLHEIARQPGAFLDLEMESRYLDQVRVYSRFGFFKSEGRKLKNALEGVVHSRSGEEHDTHFGSEQSRYQITLALSLEGFGWNHFKVSGRSLSVDFSYVGFNKNSPDACAIRRFVYQEQDRLREGKVNASFEVEMPTYDDSEGVEKVVLTLQTPEYRYDSNGKMEKPVMQTKEMLEILYPVADRVSLGLNRMREYRKKQEQDEIDRVHNAMFSI